MPILVCRLPTLGTAFQKVFHSSDVSGFVSRQSGSLHPAATHFVLVVRLEGVVLDHHQEREAKRGFLALCMRVSTHTCSLCTHTFTVARTLAQISFT